MQLTHMPRSRLTRQIFQWGYDRALNGRRSWCRDIKEILQCGMVDRFEGQHWHQNSVSETYRSVVTRPDRTTTAIQGQPDKITYLQCSANVIGRNPPGGKPYLRLDRGSRTLIAKLRTGTLLLSLETGRYRQIALDQRLCIM